MQILLFFFFFNDTATTEIYTLSLHDALPISSGREPHRDAADAGLPDPARTPAGPGPTSRRGRAGRRRARGWLRDGAALGDRKSTRLNSSHANISYAVFCLKKKKEQSTSRRHT